MIDPGREGSLMALPCYRFLPVIRKDTFPKGENLWGELSSDFHQNKKMVAQVAIPSFYEGGAVT